MRITAQNPIVIKPQLADALAGISVGDTVKGKLIEMLGDSISIKTATGQVFTAALMKSAELQLGQAIELQISNISPDGVFAELKTASQKQHITEEAKLGQLLKQMDIKPEENNLQAAKLLLKYNMPVTKENINSLVTTQKSMENLAEADAPKAISLLQSKLNLNNTEVTKLVKAAAAMEPQSQKISNILFQYNDEAVELPEPAQFKTSNKPVETPNGQAAVKQPEQQKPVENNSKVAMQQLTALVSDEIPQEETPKLAKLIDTITKVFETVSQAKPEQTAYMLSKDIKITPAALKILIDHTKGENKLSKQLEGMERLIEALDDNKVEVRELKQEIKRLLIKPEQLQDKELITENFKDIVKLGSKLEVLIKEQGLENKLDTTALQDIKNNLDFIRTINNNINYLQIPMQINDSKTTAELYIFKDKKRGKSINAENATILIALDLNKLGHIESLVSVNRKSVDVTFRLQKEEMKKVISSASDTLKQALEARGYSLSALKLIDIKEKFNLLELEELTGGDLDQLHVDIKV